MMNASDWLDLTVLERKKYNYLNEALDLTQQIGNALDHNDQISLKMLLAMRQEPIMYLEELKQTIQARRQDLPPEDQERGGFSADAGGEHLCAAGGHSHPPVAARHRAGPGRQPASDRQQLCLQQKITSVWPFPSAAARHTAIPHR